MATHETQRQAQAHAEMDNTPRIIPALLLADEAQAPDTPVLITNTERVTYAELAAAARGFAGALLALGVQRGDRVAIWLPNGVDWLVVHWGAALAGTVLVPLSTRNRPAEVAYILRQSGASVLVLQDRFLQTDYLAAVPALLASGLPELRAVIVRESVPGAGTLPSSAITWQEAIRRGAQVPADAIEARTATVTPDAIHVLQYTSGTTGYPKGAMLTHEGLIYSAGHHAATWELRPGDAILVPNPMSHILGLVFAVLMPAMSHITAITVPTFDPEQVLRLVQRERPVVLLGTPTHFQMLAEHPQLAAYDVSSLRLGMAGGAASTAEFVQRVTQRLGLVALVNGLGSSEAGSVAHTAPQDPPELHATTCGRPMPWLQTRIVDPATSADQADGQPGELWIRGPGVMKGYFRDPEATARALTPDGWLRTGDLLLRGEDGCLRFVGRLKEMFTVGGFNVYPAEVERVLAQHPAVAECQVLGVADARLGAVPFAFVCLRPEADTPAPMEDELRAFCAERLANYKVPRYIHVIESFPLTGTGKRELRVLHEMADATVAENAARAEEAGR